MRRRIRAICVAAAGMLLAAGCQSGGAHPKTSAPLTHRPTPAAGSVSVQGLTFVPPTGLKHVAGGKQNNPQATYELAGRPQGKLSPPILDVFAERGNVGPLKVRVTSIVDQVNAQLKGVKILRNQQIDVPGAQAAQVVEFTFQCTDGNGGSGYPCHQVELVMQMPAKPQYGIRYGMPQREYHKTTVDALLSSVRIVR